MITIHCTRKLLNRLRVEGADPVSAPTAVLGDWYANLLFSRPTQLILCMSERSLLPVVVPARGAGALGERLRGSLEVLLRAFGASASTIDGELREMESVAYGPARSRRALGSLNDFMFHLDVLVRDRPHLSFEEMSIRLAGTPCKPIGYQFPWEAALRLLGVSAGKSGLLR